jgi:hypothetical protein
MWLLKDLGVRSEELRSEISTESLRDLPRPWDWTTGSQSPLRVSKNKLLLMDGATHDRVVP